MLYVTTRDPVDSFTSHRVLFENTASDGGMFIPMKLPVFTKEQLCDLKDASFGSVVSFVLNLFFDTKISNRDIDLIIGHSPVKYATMNHRLIIAELWHNQDNEYSCFEKAVYEKLADCVSSQNVPQWPKIAIRISILFGIWNELRKLGVNTLDVALPAGDFLLPIALWYAKNMGLPIGIIICACDEKSSVWEFIHSGELICSQTNFDKLAGIERLIFDAFGREACINYLDACKNNNVYKINDSNLSVLKERIFATVPSKPRLFSVIKSVYATNGFILDFDTAASYGALQDYRARKGEGRMTIILSDKSPMLSSTSIGQILGLSNKELRSKLNAQKG